MWWVLGFAAAVALAIIPGFRHLPLVVALVFLWIVISPLAALTLLGLFLFVQTKRSPVAW